jgi:serine/threonine protein kinase
MDRVLAGRYELEVPLGRGGSGEVWRGMDMATHRPVAIKLVELSQIDDPGMLAETIARFRRETTVISGLRHPNIVGAIDAGRIGNQLFMIMELAPGISLASMMDERGARGMGLFPVSSVLRMGEQVSAGLAAAHAAGVVHRDIKPSNLMVTPSLGVKIIDFGIARLLTDNSPRLTLPAQTVGTIAYMSPEQAQGVDVDGRADLYSLGCVLYQLLSGRPPFFSSLPSALLMMQVLDRAVPLGALRPDLPPDFPGVVRHVL